MKKLFAILLTMLLVAVVCNTTMASTVKDNSGFEFAQVDQSMENAPVIMIDFKASKDSTLGIINLNTYNNFYPANTALFERYMSLSILSANKIKKVSNKHLKTSGAARICLLCLCYSKASLDVSALKEVRIRGDDNLALKI